MASANTSHEVYSSFQIEHRRFENLIDPTKHPKKQIECFIDRLNGMTFSEMMKKYEPDNFHKDKKGQKYRRRFDRFTDKLGIKKSVREYIKKTERVL